MWYIFRSYHSLYIWINILELKTNDVLFMWFPWHCLWVLKSRENAVSVCFRVSEAASLGTWRHLGGNCTGNKPAGQKLWFKCFFFYFWLCFNKRKHNNRTSAPLLKPKMVAINNLTFHRINGDVFLCLNPHIIWPCPIWWMAKDF